MALVGLKPKASPFAVAEDEDDLADLYAKPKATVATTAKPPPAAKFVDTAAQQKARTDAIALKTDPRSQYRNTYTGVDPYSIEYEAGLDPVTGRGQAVYDSSGRYIGYQDADAKHSEWIRGEDGRVFVRDPRGGGFIETGFTAGESSGASKSVREREETRGQAIASKIGAAPGSLQRRADGWYENGVKVADTAGNLTSEGAKYATAVAPKEQGKSQFVTMSEQARADVEKNQATREQEKNEYQDFLMQYAELEFDPQFRDSMIRAEQQEQQLRDKLLAFDPKAQSQIDSDRALREQLSVAGATRGGLGAQLASRDRAQAMAPQLQQAALDANLQREQANLGQVGASLGRSADIAATGWQQDDARANTKAQIGLGIGAQLGQMMGIDWQLDSKEAMALSDFAAELVRLEQSGQALDNQMALGRLQAQMSKYGIDLQNSANMKSLYAQLESQRIGWDDIGMLALSAGGQIGASYAGKR